MATLSLTNPVVGGDEDTWGGILNGNFDAIGTFIGALDSAELAVLDGITVSTAELNILDGVAASTAEINQLAGTAITTYAKTLLDDANATAARATLGLGGLATLDILDEDDFASNSATRPPSQQSVGAYLASQLAARRYVSSAQTITSGGFLVLSHGLGAEPAFVQFVLECTTAENSYSVGDRIFVNVGENSTSGSNRHNSVKVDATNITIRFSNDPQVFAVGRAGTGAMVELTNANWRLYVKAGL